jgi:hypothetical protein
MTQTTCERASTSPWRRFAAGPGPYGDPTPCTDWTAGRQPSGFGLSWPSTGAQAGVAFGLTEDERRPLRGVPEAGGSTGPPSQARRPAPGRTRPPGKATRCSGRADARRRDRVDDDRRARAAWVDARPARELTVPEPLAAAFPAWSRSRAWAATAGGLPEVRCPRTPDAGPRARSVRATPPGRPGSLRPAGGACQRRRVCPPGPLAREEPGGDISANWSESAAGRREQYLFVAASAPGAPSGIPT